jgi:hypothetical protein
MSTRAITSKQYFTTLTVLHGALLMVQVIFAAVAYYLVSTGQFPVSQDLEGLLKIVAVVALGVGIGTSIFISKALLSSTRKKVALKDKLKDYQRVLLIKWALLEAPSMFCIVGFLLTGSYFILGLVGPVLILFVLYRPTPAGAVMDLELISSEKSLVENPNSLVTEINQPE